MLRYSSDFFIAHFLVGAVRKSCISEEASYYLVSQMCWYREVYNNRGNSLNRRKGREGKEEEEEGEGRERGDKGGMEHRIVYFMMEGRSETEKANNTPNGSSQNGKRICIFERDLQDCTMDYAYYDDWYYGFDRVKREKKRGRSQCMISTEIDRNRLLSNRVSSILWPPRQFVLFKWTIEWPTRRENHLPWKWEGNRPSSDGKEEVETKKKRREKKSGFVRSLVGALRR